MPDFLIVLELAALPARANFARGFLDEVLRVSGRGVSLRLRLVFLTAGSALFAAISVYVGQQPRRQVLVEALASPCSRDQAGCGEALLERRPASSLQRTEPAARRTSSASISGSQGCSSVAEPSEAVVPA